MSPEECMSIGSVSVNGVKVPVLSDEATVFIPF
jgi:hypothetical protein